MSENIIEVRQSRRFLITACVSGLLGISVFLVACVLFIRVLVIRNETYGNIIGVSISLATCFGVVIAVLCIIIYLLYRYKCQKDTYTETKLIRKVKEKIIFELPYENIISIKVCSFDLLAMELKSYIIEANGKRGTRNFFEHYSRTDISKIKRIIAEKYNNIPFN